MIATYEGKLSIEALCETFITPNKPQLLPSDSLLSVGRPKLSQDFIKQLSEVLVMSTQPSLTNVVLWLAWWLQCDFLRPASQKYC